MKYERYGISFETVNTIKELETETGNGELNFDIIPKDKEPTYANGKPHLAILGKEDEHGCPVIGFVELTPKNLALAQKALELLQQAVANE